MKEKALTVEFRLAPTRTTPRPRLGEKAEQQRQERAARRARNLALAYWIDGLVRSGEVADLAAVARRGYVSRARVSRLLSLLSTPLSSQEILLIGGYAHTRLDRRS